MKIDNSRAKLWWTCPLAYRERYVNNIEPRDRNSDALEFGTRMHQLLELRHLVLRGDERCPVYLPHATLEAEAQLTLAAYESHYPEEPFDVVDVEKYFEVRLPCKGCPHDWGLERLCDCHIYCGEFDAIVRMRDSGRLWLLETKTERRGGKDNLPEAWQQKSQVGLYLWAAEQVYGQEFEGILLNVITRQSPKGQERPSFRRDSLVRSPGQQREAVRNIVWIADQIERNQTEQYWPTNRNQCVNPMGWRCDYYALHSTEERSEELVQIKYKEAEKYLAGF